MKYCVYFVEIVVCKVFDEFGFVEIVVDFVIDEIVKFVCVGQVVDCDDVCFVVFVECFDDVCVDKIGCVGDDEGYDCFV